MVVAALPLRLFSSVSRQRKSVRDCRAKLKVALGTVFQKIIRRRK